MKKRQFLTPLAFSLVALLSTVANASLSPTIDTAESALPGPQVAGSNTQINDFVLEPAAKSLQVANHYSHYSHSSHTSHSSHSSHYSV